MYVVGVFWFFCFIVFWWSLYFRVCIFWCRILLEFVRGGDGNMGWYRKEKKYFKCVVGNLVVKFLSNKVLEISDWVVCVVWFLVWVIELVFYFVY